MLVLLRTRLSALLADLRTLPDGLETPVAAGLLVADVLRSLDWDDRAIAVATGVDLAAVEGERVVVLR